VSSDHLLGYKDHQGTVVIDFSSMEFARPFGTLVLGATLKELVAHRKRAGLLTSYRSGQLKSERQTDTVGYLGHVGFFDFVGIPYRYEAGHARGSARYLPITQLSFADLAQTGRGSLQRSVKARSHQLARFVGSDESIVDVVAYCFQETIRNVFEHSQSESCCLMAQRLADEVEIAILDEGIGIRASLEKRFSVPSAGEALRMAVSPGVSCAQKANSDPDVENVGFGLFVLSRLGRDTGEFRLTTRGASLYLSGKKERLSEDSVPGTAVKLSVNVTEAAYFPNQLATIVAEGERLLGTQSSRPQAPSKVLRRTGRSQS
jgi:hypothetical protein